MLKVFNAFQITATFAAAPLVIAWLYTANFVGAQVALPVACVAYVVGFCMMTVSVYESL